MRARHHARPARALVADHGARLDELQPRGLGYALALSQVRGEAEAHRAGTRRATLDRGPATLAGVHKGNARQALAYQCRQSVSPRLVARSYRHHGRNANEGQEDTPPAPLRIEGLAPCLHQQRCKDEKQKGRQQAKLGAHPLAFAPIQPLAFQNSPVRRPSRKPPQTTNSAIAVHIAASFSTHLLGPVTTSPDVSTEWLTFIHRAAAISPATAPTETITIEGLESSVPASCEDCSGFMRPDMP